MDLTILAGVAAVFMWVGALLYNKKLIKECNRVKKQNALLRDYNDGLAKANEQLYDEAYDAGYKFGLKNGSKDLIKEIGKSMLYDSYILNNGTMISPSDNFYRPSC